MATTSAPVPLEYVKLFTDGACKGNPGPGGWAFILQHPASGKAHEGAGGEGHTTNNRMELMGVIRGLELLRLPLTVDLYSDSQYVLKGMREWMAGWKRNGWRTADRQPVKNQRPVGGAGRAEGEAHGALQLGARSLGASGERALRSHGRGRAQTSRVAGPDAMTRRLGPWRGSDAGPDTRLDPGPDAGLDAGS
jgi:hypothetical protein